MTTTNPPPPKRRPYNASGSLSEYGVFPECDAQQMDKIEQRAWELLEAECGKPLPFDVPTYVALAAIRAALSQQPTAHLAITHCDNCGCDWLDNGLNPVGCPYCNSQAWARELLTLAEQWERDAGGCRRDGYIDAAVVKEDCAQRIRQTLGISAIAEAIATKHQEPT